MRPSLAALALCAACASAPIPTGTEVPSGPTEPSPSTGEEQDPVIRIRTADGLQLAGTFAPAMGEPPRPGVILLHMLGSDRSAWEEFAQGLAQEGFASLAVDLRGHGDSGDEVNWQLAESDLQAVWDYFAGRADIEEDQIAVMGASIGANLALNLAAENESASGAVLLSPGLDYQGVVTDQAMLAYAGRSALILASSEDSYAANSSRTLQQLGGESVELRMLSGAGHGTQMLGAQPELADQIIAWLAAQLN